MANDSSIIASPSGQRAVPGARFGRLRVERLVRIPVQHKKMRTRAGAVVECDCGTRKTVSADDLASGRIRSCGCLKRDLAKSRVRPVADRFLEKVDKDGPVPEYRPDLGPCWVWTAARNANGYGIMKVSEGTTLAHRISYALAGGNVTDDEQIDHLCRVRHCVNPQHLEAVPPRVNVHRGYGSAAGNARKTHCPQGHPYNDENAYVYVGGVHKGTRHCRICGRAATRRYMARKKAAALK